MAEVGSPFSIFIDTNLDTHLAILVDPTDTVADLKRKIRAEHLLCFPEIGEISIKSLKIKRRASFYHMSDSMIVKSAFVGIMGTWFLYIDLAPMSMVGCQQEPARIITSESGREPEKHKLLQTDQSVSPSLVNGAQFAINGPPGSIQTSPYNALLKNSAQDNSILPNSQAPDLHVSPNASPVFGDESVDVSSHLNVAQNDLNDNSTVPPPKLEKSSVPEVPELEMIVAESNAVVGSGHMEEKVGIEVDNVGVSVDATLKEKSKKRGRTLQNVQMLDGKSQNPSPSMKKKRHKKEKDGSSKDPVESPPAGGSFSKEMSPLEKDLLSVIEEKHRNNQAVDYKQKKKNKKRSKLHDDGVQNKLVDKSFDKINSAVGKQVSEENHIGELVQNQATLEIESDATKIIDEGTQKVANSGLNKPTTTETGLPIQEVSNVNAEGHLLDDSSLLSKESNDATIYKETEQPSNHAVVVPKVRSRKKSKSENDTTKKPDTLDSSVKSLNEEKNDDAFSGVAMAGADLGGEKATEADPQITSDSQMRSSHHIEKKEREKPELPDAHLAHETVNSLKNQVTKESQRKTSCSRQEHLAVGECTVPSNPSDRKPKRNRKKSQKAELSHQDHNDTLIDKVVEDIPGKESQAAAVENPEDVEATVYPKPNEKKPKGKGNKSGNIELPHQETMRDESVHLLVEETTTKEDPKENLEGAAEAAVVANTEILEPEVPLIPNDKKSKPNRKKSKLGKSELPRQETSKDESINHLELAIVDVRLEKSGEKSSLETLNDKVHEGSKDLNKANVCADQPRSDSEKTNNFKSCTSNSNQLEPAEDVSFVTTQTKKANLEKSKRKRKLNASPRDFTTNSLKPSVQDELSLEKEQLLSNDSTKSHQNISKKSEHKSDVHLQDKSSDLGLMSNNEKSRHRIGKKSVPLGSKLQFPIHNKCEDLKAPTNENTYDLAASDDTTEENTPVQKRFRVAVRKIPSNRYGKVLNKSDEEKIPLAPTVSIFNDAESGSSEDEDNYEVKNRKGLMRAPDSSSSSSESEENIQETQISTALSKPQAYENFPGSVSHGHHKGDRETNAQSNFTQPTNAKKKDLSKILKNSSSYKIAKLRASQSEFDDSESQVVRDSQPELSIP